MEGSMASTTRMTKTAVLALLAAMAAVGCGGSTAGAPPAATAASASEDDTSAGLVEHHRYHHHGGVTLFIAMSLDTLGVSPEQHAAVEKIRTDLHARMESARLAEQNLLTSLADGAAAGSVDATKVDAAIVQLNVAVASVHDGSADALDALHAVLTPAQRAALVDKVESHWAVWRSANVDDPVHPAADQLAAFAADLDLTPDQVDRMRAALGATTKAAPQFDPQPITTHLRAFGDAFRSETFQARALTTASDANTHLVGWGAARLAHFVETVSPLLTPEQRALLAQRLREHANHNPSAQGNP
jgi:Spy/CpxP family protein refolding chaperone